jgi:hypothetical protein
MSANVVSMSSARTTFLSLPAELRLQVYGYFLPHQVMPSGCAGLRRTCRQTRAEFDREAFKHFPALYQQFPHKLGSTATICSARLLVMADISVVELKLRIENAMWPSSNNPYYLNAYDLIPWNWLWVKTLIISVDLLWANPAMSNDSAKYIADHSNRMDYELGAWVQAIAENTEMNTIIVRWSFKPLHHFDKIEKYSNTINYESRRHWIMSLRCDTQAGFAETAWRRRPNGIKSLLLWLVASYEMVASSRTFDFALVISRALSY